VFNHVVMVGRTTGRPELRYTKDGTPVTSFVLAVDRPVAKDSDGNRVSDFFDVVAWRKAAEVITQYVDKGHLLLVEGRIEINSFVGRDGMRRRQPRVIASSVKLFPKTMKPGADQAQVSGNTDAPSDDSLETVAVGAEAETEDVDVPF
jgi:single-strand DNA-binding protein